MAATLPRIVVLGATSAIAEAAARYWAADGAIIHLVARNADRVADIAADLRLRGARQVTSRAVDLADATAQNDVVQESLAALGAEPDVVLIAWGVLPDQDDVVNDASAARESLVTNFLAPAEYILRFAAPMRQRGAGTIVVLGSVAGDLGRASNFVYGAAKGGLEVFCEGARRRFRPDGVRVIVVKPGFVDSPMTRHLPKNRLFASPARVGRIVYRAASRARGPVYAPPMWRVIMTLLRVLPRRVFDRLPL
jgi:decaprenylphospho-beta-D-erythro-pentofuranosid-2-ulose 2-reductase